MIGGNGWASDDDDFSRIDQALDQQFQGIDDDLDAQYLRIDQALETAYQRFAQAIEAQWGKDDVVLPDRKRWVDYSDDLSVRRTFDFEQGVLKVEKVVPADTSKESVLDELRKAAGEASRDTETDLARKDQAVAYARKLLGGADVELSAPKSYDAKPVLADIVSPAGIEKVSAKSLTETPVAPVSRAKAKKVAIEIPYEGDYRLAMARRYEDTVLQQANVHGIEPSLIFAIIETESSFNPRARSGAPAYGLMQLVPTSGAMDAYQFLFNQKKLLDPEYLYNPEQNITLGVGYFKLLVSRYLAAVTDRSSREYCAIAAYNTGAGNVARAFTNTTSPKQAAKIINKMSAGQVFDHMREKLPYEETQRYIVKVTDAQRRYRSFDI